VNTPAPWITAGDLELPAGMLDDDPIVVDAIKAASEVTSTSWTNGSNRESTTSGYPQHPSVDPPRRKAGGIWARGVEHRIEGSAATIPAEAKKLAALERGVHEAR